MDLMVCALVKNWRDLASFVPLDYSKTVRFNQAKISTNLNESHVSDTINKSKSGKSARK